MTRPSYFGPKPKIKKKAQNSLFWAFRNSYFGLFWAFFKTLQNTLISIIMYDSYYIFNNYHIIYHIYYIIFVYFISYQYTLFNLRNDNIIKKIHF